MTPAEEAGAHSRARGHRKRRQARQLLADRRQADRTGHGRRPRRGVPRAPPRPFSNGGESRRRAAASSSGLLGERLREAKPVLAKLITLESGKILQESLGEVQEMIDICDFAVGLSRQLYGLTIASERPDHRMMEQWHPLGPVLVISAFNFPGRGLGVECRAGAGLRQSGDLEAEREDAALRGSGDGARPPRRRTLRRCARRACPARPGRTRRRGSAGRRSAHRAGFGDRLDGDGPRGRAARRRSASAACCSSSAATMRRSSRRRPTSSLRRAPSSSPRRERRASAARPCGG